MNDEKPTVTPVGNLYDLLGSSCSSAPTYQVGDYVWATGNPDGTGTKWLAHIVSVHSVRSFSGGRRWRVRVRRRQFWTSGELFMYVDRRLTTDEFLHNRRLGLIPPAGERP